MRAPRRSRVQAGGGASAVDLGRVVLRREASPDQAGQTAARGAVAGDCARAGVVGAMLRMAPRGAAIWQRSDDRSLGALGNLRMATAMITGRARIRRGQAVMRAIEQHFHG